MKFNTYFYLLIAFTAINNIAFSQSQVCFNNSPLNYTFPTNSGSMNVMTSGLMDDDSLPDLIYASPISIYIQKSLGNGLFGGQTNILNMTGVGVPKSIKCKDIDGDHREDIIIGTDNSYLTIIWNDSANHFSVPLQLNIASGFGVILAEKFDSDTFVDLVLVGSSSYHFLHYNGNRTFTDSLYTLPYNSIYDAAAGKVNSDNFKDLVFTRSASPNLVKMTGNGDGTFTTFLTDTVPPVTYIISADVNNDGNDDIFCAGVGKMYVFYCNSSSVNTSTDTLFYGNQNPSINKPISFISDLNNDLFPEIIVLHPDKDNVSVYLNNAGNGFTDTRYGVNSTLLGGALADFNGDGLKDVVSFHPYNQTYSILLGKPGGVFNGTVWIKGTISNYSSTDRNLGVNDFNHDGWMDFVCADLSDSIVVYINNGNGSYTRNSYYSHYPSYAISLADFNHDGNMDAAIIGQYNVAIMLGNASGGFTFSQNITAGNVNYCIETADLKNDSFPDIVIGSQSLIQVIMNNSGTLAPPVGITGTGSAEDITSGDFNGDGFPDLAADHHGGMLLLILNDGTGGFTVSQMTDPCVYAQYYAVTAVDYDVDGKTDIVAGNWSGCVSPAEIIFYRNTGNAVFAIPVKLGVVDDIYLITTGDLNKDSLPDIVYTTVYDNAAVLLNNGGSFSQSNLIKGGGEHMDVAVADFDNDHRPDIAMTNVGSKDISILYNGITRMSASGNYNLCQGDTLKLYPIDPVPPYIWQPGNIAADTLLVNSGGYYYPVAMDFGQCVGAGAVSVTMRQKPNVNFIPLPVDSICDTAAAITLSGAPSGGVFSGSGVSGNSFLPYGLAQGNYYLNYTYTNNYNCSATDKDTIFVINCGNTVGVDEYTNTMPYLAPNPASDQLHIYNTNNISRVEITDMTGRILWINNNLKQPELNINLEKFKEGIYMINLYEGEKGFRQFKLIKS